MKCVSVTTIVLLFVFLLNPSLCESIDCDCAHHAGGCAISLPSPKGFKCRCLYKGFWTCSGVSFPCSDDEYCPGGRASYCACVQGNSDCGAYYQPPSRRFCSRINSRELRVASPLDGTTPSIPSCDCSYHAGGCTISKPAPEGYKCVCVYKGFWTCNGWPQGCTEGEYCPGGEYDYCGCMRGHGDCEAYPEHGTGTQCDFNPPPARTCDCDRNSDWTKGQYTIKNVHFDSNGIVRRNPKPVAVGDSLDIPNASDVEQSQTFTPSKWFTTSSEFRYTSGIEIAVGTEFTATIPYLGEFKTSLSVTSSHSFTWGSTKTISDRFSHSFVCKGPSKQHTRCQAFLTSFDVEIPYTMTLEHSTIPGCSCTSHGIWKGVASYNSKLTAQKIGDCQALNSLGQCVNNN